MIAKEKNAATTRTDGLGYDGHKLVALSLRHGRSYPLFRATGIRASRLELAGERSFRHAAPVTPGQ